MTVADDAAALSHEELLEAYAKVCSQKAELEHELTWFKRQYFGRKSEKPNVPYLSAKQLSLGEEYESDETPPAPTETVKSYERSHRKRPVEFVDADSRLKFDESVPVEEIVLECPETNGLSADQYEVISEKITYRLAQRPGSYVVLKYIRPVVKLHGEIKECPAPPAVIERSVADVSFLAGLALDKFRYHLPLYRQHQRLEASGVYLSGMTLTNLIHRTAELLGPIYRSLQSSILTSAVIGMDETPVKVERNPNKRQMKQGYLWAIYGDKDELAFLYSPSRSGQIVRKALSDFTGTLITDGYKVYERFAEVREEVLHAQCWVHARRKFVEAQSDQPALCSQALEIIAELYHAESEHGSRGREQYSKPIVERFFSWLRESVTKLALLPSSPFLKAASYALSRERALRVFLEDPNVALDTNHVEREIRPVAIGRKNWLFHWTEVGAENAAILQSLIASCRLQEVDPFTYLVDVLQRIESHPMFDVDQLLPRNWKTFFGDNPLRSNLDRRKNGAD